MEFARQKSPTTGKCSKFETTHLAKSQLLGTPRHPRRNLTLTNEGTNKQRKTGRTYHYTLNVECTQEPIISVQRKLCPIVRG